MGISTGGSERGPRSYINITPLVDVVLVLLIIFLVVMPIGMHHIPVEVPREAEPIEVAPAAIVLFGSADGTVQLEDGTGARRSVSRSDLATTIRPMVEALEDERVVFVDFDNEVEYEDVVSIMDTVKGMGKDAAGHDVNPVKVAVKTAGRGGAAR
jgi:biopolymer transport protein TolR